MRRPARGSPVVLVALALLVLAGLGLRVDYAVEQRATVPPDALAYERLAESLERDGSYDARPPGQAREVQPSSAYSPGLPLLVAGLYLLTGGPHETFALVVLALIAAAAIPLAFLLGRRFGGPAAGLIAAAAIAFYPALLEYQGLLLTEPLAATLLTGGLVSFFAAAERPLRGGFPWAWAGTGLVWGMLALVRPEYLLLALGLPVFWLGWTVVRRVVRPEDEKGAARGRVLARVAVSVLATCLVIAPWTIRNATDLHRFVPISTGGGKALYIGTDLHGDGDSVGVREALLAERPRLRERIERQGPIDDPKTMALEQALSQVARNAYPDLETDAALGRLGRTNLGDELSGEPLRLGGMFARKAYASWTDAARGIMLDQPWRALQLAIVVLSLIGVAILWLRRRFEAAIVSLVLLYMTVVAAVLISSPRRELVVLPLLAALAGTCIAEGVRAVSPRRRPRTSA